MQLLRPEILFVSHKHPPGTGGMEKQNYELVEGIAKYTKIHRLVFQKDKESLLMFFWQLNRSILRILNENPNIQIVHFNDGLIAAIALRHKGYQNLKRVVTLHGLDVVFPWPYFQKKILPKFNMYDQIIAVSHATAIEAINRGIAPEKVTVIANGVDHQIAEIPPQSLEELQNRYPSIKSKGSFMITLGRPVQRKGFSWLLDQVVREMPNEFQLLMIGPYNAKSSWLEKLLNLLPKRIYQMLTLFLGYPSDEKNIRKLLKDPDIGSKVEHLGKIPFDDLRSFLVHSSSFLMPNIQVPGDMEGFGLVCLEASLAGTLVLASATEGITDAIIDKKNGILVQSGDKEAWKSIMTKVYNNPSEFQDDKKKYQSYSKQHYSWEKMSASYWNVFQNLYTNPTFAHSNNKSTELHVL